ncbi:NUDIX hydrolase domain-containing protein [Apiospora kogelbergensis]|uniref:NUDIX hydrolase domain-containing protein n=1 Tax=Apiospora kogelbergensis TaxID=1337665 RepID=A0AAW0R9A5_9PEZI
MSASNARDAPLPLIPEHLRPYLITPAAYLEQHKSENVAHLVVGTVVIGNGNRKGTQLYTPPSPPSRISHYQYPSTSHKKPLQHPQKVLLVQRSRHDYGGLCWEIPGGSCDPHDVSILDAAARELTEEAGLRVRRFVAVVDRQRHEWIDRGELWRKLTFIVEADDADTFADGEDGYGEEQERGRSPLPRVRLDPEEHEDFVWATREDLMVGGVGERMFTWIQDEQRQVILRALDIVEGVSSTLP